VEAHVTLEAVANAVAMLRRQQQPYLARAFEEGAWRLRPAASSSSFAAAAAPPSTTIHHPPSPAGVLIGVKAKAFREGCRRYLRETFFSDARRQQSALAMLKRACLDQAPATAALAALGEPVQGPAPESTSAAAVMVEETLVQPGAPPSVTLPVPRPKVLQRLLEEVLYHECLGFVRIGDQGSPKVGRQGMLL
jgi:hypothetical protein